MKRTTRLIALIVALLLALPMAALAEGSPVVRSSNLIAWV